jgi:hypothetical protein
MAQLSATTLSPSTSTGTFDCPLKATSSLSVNFIARSSGVSPLWASARRARQQKGLGRRSSAQRRS